MATVVFPDGSTRAVPDEALPSGDGVGIKWRDESDNTDHTIPWTAIQEFITPYEVPEFATA
jgi:hypothetical protein